jgi:hypothetical protein
LWLRVPAQQEGSQPDPGYPALGAGMQQRILLRGQVESTAFGEARRLLRREGELGGAQLAQPVLQSEPGKGEGRVEPTTEHEPDVVQPIASPCPGERRLRRADGPLSTFEQPPLAHGSRSRRASFVPASCAGVADSGVGLPVDVQPVTTSDRPGCDPGAGRRITPHE